MARFPAPWSVELADVVDHFAVVRQRARCGDLHGAAQLGHGLQALGDGRRQAGVGNTELQARAIADIRPRAYVGTPDFLQVILEKADALSLDCGSIELAHVSGGPYLPPQRAFYEARGIAVYQSYGTADLGLVAYESAAREGLIVDEGVIVEIVRPGTGDLSAVLPGASPCGRSNMRIKGWMGRADQTAKVKGMFVRPEQVAQLVARHSHVHKARVIITRENEMDRMHVQIEADGGDWTEYGADVKDLLKLKATIEVLAPGELPKDGIVIEDRRVYD